jgi:hypothetical protein
MKDSNDLKTPITHLPKHNQMTRPMNDSLRSSSVCAAKPEMVSSDPLSEFSASYTADLRRICAKAI